MVPDRSVKTHAESTEDLFGLLNVAWESLCSAYDVGGRLPEMESLFDGADITTPRQAAEIVVANMLMEISESISRFSPWYTRPSRAFGLNSVKDTATNHSRWTLAPEAIQKWQPIIASLAISIRQNISFIQAVLLVDRLMDGLDFDKTEFVNARCSCTPPYTIKVSKAALDKEDISCKVCNHPFA